MSFLLPSEASNQAPAPVAAHSMPPVQYSIPLDPTQEQPPPTPPPVAEPLVTFRQSAAPARPSWWKATPAPGAAEWNSDAPAVPKDEALLPTTAYDPPPPASLPGPHRPAQQPVPWFLGWHPPAAASVADPGVGGPKPSVSKPPVPDAGRAPPPENPAAPPANQRPVSAAAGEWSGAAPPMLAALADRIRTSEKPKQAVLPSGPPAGAAARPSWNEQPREMAKPAVSSGASGAATVLTVPRERAREKPRAAASSSGVRVTPPALVLGSRKSQKAPAAAAAVASKPRPGVDSGKPSAEKIAQWMDMCVCPLTLVCVFNLQSRVVEGDTLAFWYARVLDSFRLHCRSKFQAN